MMKACIFCRMQIHEDAIKCPHCQSMLLPLQSEDQKTTSDDRRVTYVLDQDLVRFGKFAGAVLAVFITVGATLYGFKLQEGLEKAKALQAEAKDLRDKARDDLQTTQSKIKTLNEEVDKTLTIERERLAKTELLLDQIQGNSNRATEIVQSMALHLTPGQNASLPDLKAAQPDKARQGLKNKYWANGATLRILFLDGDDRSRQAIKDALTTL
jgi:hypothetical protein